MKTTRKVETNHTKLYIAKKERENSMFNPFIKLQEELTPKRRLSAEGEDFLLGGLLPQVAFVPQLSHSTS